MRRQGADTATLAPYLPRIAIDWAGSDPSTTFRVVDGSLIFADISGFTALSERLARKGRVGAEELTETLSRCFGELLAVAYDAGGSLLKFGGDALLLLFRDDGHAMRACASALAMRARMADTGRVTTSVGPVRLRMSVGVHSGEVHLFRVGSSHRELIIAGPTATATVDMESAATANQILVSPATAALIDKALVGAPAGPGFLLRDRTVPGVTGMATIGPVGPVPGASLAIPVALRQHLQAGRVESEHRNVSIAFVHFDDVDGLVRDEGPVALAAAIEEVVVDVQAAADEHGVTFLASDVDRDGGKIILVTGAPRALGDDEGRMLRCLRQIASGSRRLPVRIGVNRGHVFVGEVGPPFRRTYTVMGDAVNLAARLMAKASAGQVLTTGVVLDHSATSFTTTALEPFMVKGKSEPVQAYVLGVQGDRRNDPARAHLPLVGRDEDVDALAAALGGAARGAGKLADITGEAGLGKTRLLDEVVARADGFRVVRAFCEPYEAQTPYYAVRFLLRALAGVKGSRTEGGEELRVAVAASAPALLPWLPLLATVADVDVAPTPEADGLGERFRRQRTQRVVVELLRALVDEPVLLLVDDGEWLDALSAELIGALADEAAEQPWMLCVARRTTDAEATTPLAGATLQVGLRPLDDDAARALVSAATVGAPLLPHHRDRLVAQAGGNPLFLEELLRAPLEGGADDPLPESLEALVATQIDRLPPDDRRLLRYTSVLGTTFDVGLLAAVTAGELRTAAAAIRRFPGMLELAGPGLLRFRNECYRRVAYDALPFRRRRALHAEAGVALERATAGREAERAGALSFHFLHAQSYDRCWRYASVAARHARETYANVEAVDLYERALSVRRHVTAVSDVEVAETWEALGDVAVRAGVVERARLAYSRARALRNDDPTAYAELCGKAYRVAMHQGRSARAIRWLRKGLRVLDGNNDAVALARRAELRHFYAHNRQQGGHPRDALKWCRLAEEDARRSGNRSVLAWVYLLEDWALMALGRVDEAVNSRQALVICEELGSPERVAEVLLYLGNFASMEGKWAEALDLYARANEAYTRAGNTVDAALCVCNSAEFLVYQGRYDEAEPLLLRALEVWESMSYSGGLAEVLTHLGRLHLNRGNVDEAVRLYERVRRLCSDAGDAREIGALGALAECRLREGAPAEALDLVEGALRREQLSGDRQYAAMLHRVQGYAHAAVGNLVDAWADFDESLAVARGRGHVFEVALTLEAISVVAELGGLPLDGSAEDERAALLAQLGVQVTPPPPLHIAA